MFLFPFWELLKGSDEDLSDHNHLFLSYGSCIAITSTPAAVMWSTVPCLISFCLDYLHFTLFFILSICQEKEEGNKEERIQDLISSLNNSVS